MYMGNSFSHRILVLPIWGHFTTSNAQLHPKSFLQQPTFPLEICFRNLVKDSSWIYCSPTVCWVHACYSDCAHTRLCTCRPEHNLVLLLKKLSILLSPFFFCKRVRETDINIYIQRYRQTDRLTDTDRVAHWTGTRQPTLRISSLPLPLWDYMAVLIHSVFCFMSSGWWNSGPLYQLSSFPSSLSLKYK